MNADKPKRDWELIVSVACFVLAGVLLAAGMVIGL